MTYELFQLLSTEKTREDLSRITAISQNTKLFPGFYGTAQKKTRDEQLNDIFKEKETFHARYTTVRTK